MKNTSISKPDKKICLMLMSLLLALIISVQAVAEDAEALPSDGTAVTVKEENPVKSSKSSSPLFFARNHWLCTNLASFLMDLPKKEINLGATFEHKLTDYAGLKGGLSYGYCSPEETVKANDIGFIAEAAWYPVGAGLEKFHIGAGLDADCILYSHDSCYEGKDWVLSVYPLIGWKQNFFNFAAADMSIGYKFLINEPDEKTMMYDIYDSGLTVNFNFLVNWKKLFSVFK